MSIENARKIVLSFAETGEEPHFEKTSFRVGKKIFATYDAVAKMLCVKLSLVDQNVFCTYDKALIYAVPNKWGAQGWTFVLPDQIPEAMLKDVLQCAYTAVAPKKLGDLLKKER